MNHRLWVSLLMSALAASAQDGAALFTKNCAVCHQTGSETRAPLPDALSKMGRARILASLETGTMKAQAKALAAAERAAIAMFLVPKDIASPESMSNGLCPSGSAPLVDSAWWNGWGVDGANTRFQPAKMAGLAPEQVGRLKLKWAFGFPGANTAFSQPSVVAGRLFFGSEDGTVYSVDARSGCIYWTFKAPSTVRSAISVGTSRSGRYAVYFGDIKSNVYAVDASTGRQLWTKQVETHPFSRITGAPKLVASRLYVPVSSAEEVPAASAKYPCCTFRGSLVALDVERGEQLWKSYTIPDQAGPTRKNPAGTQLMGPAGAAIWSSPTVDLKRKAIYVATGNGYADPPVKYTDAILAFDVETGSLRWAQQMTPNDGWNFSCANPSKGSCPEAAGEDFDFGSSPMLLKLSDGRDLLVVGQKSGFVHGLDPDRQGKIVWQTQIGKGSALGGIEWGTAADDRAVYAPLSDIHRSPTPGGLFALKPATGERIWYAAPPKPACAGKFGCSSAQMAPATVIPGVVFSGSMDGHLRAYSTADGKVVWDYDTLQEYQTVNGVKARGGSLNATGPTVVAGMLYVNSGYGALGGMAGNVLLAFSVDGK